MIHDLNDLKNKKVTTLEIANAIGKPVKTVENYFYGSGRKCSEIIEAYLNTRHDKQNFNNIPTEEKTLSSMLMNGFSYCEAIKILQ